MAKTEFIHKSEGGRIANAEIEMVQPAVHLDKGTYRYSELFITYLRCIK